MSLRPYQLEAVHACRAALRDPRRVCLVMPTGAGKTITAHAIVDGGDALWIVHRRELAQQAPGRAITIQSLLSGARPAADIVVLDECHHYASGAPEWLAVAQHYPRMLGLTATPQRGDGTPLGDLFEVLVVGARYSDLIRDGYLVHAKIYRPPEEVCGLAIEPHMAWERYAGGRQGFAYFSRVEQAKQFQLQVPDCATVYGDMDSHDRDTIIHRFRSGAISVLSSCQCLTEGVDIPGAAVCLIACGCDHAGTYLQRVGRVLRPAPGKAFATVIDLPGVSHRHGLPHEDREYSLDGVAIRTKVGSLSSCQQCGACYPAAPTCPECGFALPPRPISVRIWDIPLEEAATLPLTLEQASKIRFRQRWSGASDDEKAAEYRRLLMVGAERGYRRGWALYQYRLRTGHWPRR